MHHAHASYSIDNGAPIKLLSATLGWGARSDHWHIRPRSDRRIGIECRSSVGSRWRVLNTIAARV